MKKTVLIITCIILAVIMASCGEAKIVKNIGGYDVDEDLDALYDGDDGAISLFLSPYAVADKIGYDYRSEEFLAKCEAERARMLSEAYGGDEDALEDELKAASITEALYEKLIERDVLTDALYFKLISDGEISQDAASLKAEFLSGGAVRVKRIVTTGEGAKDAIEGAAEMAKTSSFEDTMKKYAFMSPAGEIGNYEDSFVFARGNYDEKYESVCFSLEVGEISEPFETDAGWCIVKRYELTEEIVDKMQNDLVVSYGEGSFSKILADAASELLR